MKILGVISEYNPFHNGHRLHVSQARERSGCDFAIALMSGNFMQRGEPALVDKYLRARMALSCGFDMVLELPVYFATASAEHFAYNAVRIFNACGIVTHIAFGSESGDLDIMRRTARVLADESESYRAALRAALNEGDSFPRARGKALDIPDQPNDILGVEYLKALYRTRSDIEPIAIQRVGAGYHQTEITGEIASATAVRRAVLSSGEKGEKDKAAGAMPEAAWEILRAALDDGRYVRGLDSYQKEFRYALFSGGRLNGIMDIAEGLENRFTAMSGKFAAPSEIISAVKTKRYTHTRLTRAALHILLDMRRCDFERYAAADIPYIRVLGMKKTAGALMDALTEAALCPVVTTLTPARKALSAEGWAMLEKEIKTTDVYYIGMENGALIAPGAERREGFVAG
ncbi:MAG: nucleotidyltransferase family protein [Defluviitaleaceae bacterium]|nr:nucleotidyltransferase family protein [Defluviitaleaceae bacterium]